MACQSCVCDTLLPLLLPSAPLTPTRPPAWAFVTLSIPTLINGFVFSSSLSLYVSLSLSLSVDNLSRFTLFLPLPQMMRLGRA